jgi:hypothetical protein
VLIVRRLPAIFALLAATLTALGSGGHTTATSVLFVGNSFTYGGGSPVRFYRSRTVTDLNDEGIGGVPALFKSFAQQAGLDYDVALETKGGVGLDYHLDQKLGVVGRRAWDIVVMHGHSTLDASKPRDPAKLIATSARMAAFFRSRNPTVDVYLMATWSRADQTYPAKGVWVGRPIEAMARDIRAAYDQAAIAAAARAVAPVGEAWNRAIQTGLADGNPYDGIAKGRINLWSFDGYHASTYGYYLEALVVFGTVTNRDPRSLGANECSAYELGVSRAHAAALQQIAFDQLSTTHPVMPAPRTVPADAGRQRCAAR